MVFCAVVCETPAEMFESLVYFIGGLLLLNDFPEYLKIKVSKRLQD